MKTNYLTLLSLAVCAFMAKAAPPAGWIDPTGLPSTMIVYAQVKAPSGALYQAAGSLLAAFSGPDVIGVASLQTGPPSSEFPLGIPYYPLNVHGNTNGEAFTYKFYNKDNDSLHTINANATFVKDSSIGTITAPITLVATAPIPSPTPEVQAPSTPPVVSSQPPAQKGKKKAKPKPKAKPKKGKTR